MADAFPPESTIRRIGDEPAIMFGAARALLLQLAHPHVAAGVDEHSDFQSNPFKRLQGTLEAVYTMVWGSEALAEGVGRRVQWIHTFVRSDAYEANDPANLMWVHATLLDTALDCHERFVRPLTAAEREGYYQDMTVVAERFGCARDRQPEDYAGFRDYWEEQMSSIEVSDVGRRLASDVIESRLPLNLHVPLAPALWMQRLVAVGTLPAPIREQYGYEWDDRQQRRLERLETLSRASTKVVPKAVRVAPAHLNGRLLLAQARKHVAQFDATRGCCR